MKKSLFLILLITITLLIIGCSKPISEENLIKEINCLLDSKDSIFYQNRLYRSELCKLIQSDLSIQQIKKYEITQFVNNIKYNFWNELITVVQSKYNIDVSTYKDLLKYTDDPSYELNCKINDWCGNFEIYYINNTFYDLNDDGKIDKIDSLTVLYPILFTTDSTEIRHSIKTFTESLITDKHGEPIHITVKKNFTIPVCSALIDTIGHKIGYDIAANKLLTSFDANTDGYISTADDINFDGVINQGDEKAMKKLWDHLNVKYFNNFNPTYISIADLLFFGQQEFGIPLSIIQKNPTEYGYAPYVYTKFIKNESKQDNYKKEIIGHEVSGDKTGASLIGAGMGGGGAYLIGASLPGIGLASLLFGGIASIMVDDNTAVYSTSFRQINVEYFQKTIEADTVVKVAVFTWYDKSKKPTREYKVLFFDASKTLTSELITETVQYYKDGKLDKSSRSITENKRSPICDQNTRNRIICFEPSRNLCVSFIGKTVQKVFYLDNPTNSITLNNNDELVAPFIKAFDQVLLVLDPMLTVLANLKGYDATKPISAQAAYLSGKN
ncbi:MAG: hypothetical protein AAB657_01570 [Patescibacteria group bacterium]